VTRSASLIAAPAPKRNWALFLDIDGTLLDIAPSPDAVRVPASLAPVLARAQARLGGALAIASGRTLAEIDQLIAPLRLPCVAEHGAVIRFPGGAVAVAGADHAVPERWKFELCAGARAWRGVMIEEKAYSVAVHYRLAPEREAEVRGLVAAVTSHDPQLFEVLPARMAFEIRHRSLTKASAVERFMPNPPFAGRIPVFVGDDVTDEDGFRAALARGGLALRVDEAFGGEPARVRQWLAAFAAAKAY
jgi:trehalose 6-phosphate phosphatase